MDTIPNGNAEQKFQELLTKLMATPAWTEKQQIELEMARDISVEMLRLAELMRDGSVDLSDYAQVRESTRFRDDHARVAARYQAANAACDFQAGRSQGRRGVSGLRPGSAEQVDMFITAALAAARGRAQRLNRMITRA
jgi:hypothetical protein